MTKVSWTNAAGGNWGTASNWDDDIVPNSANDQVYLPTLASAYVVKAAGNFTVGLLDVETNATLSITADVFSVYDGPVYDTGAIDVGAGATFALEGTYNEINGAGTVTIHGALSVQTANFCGLYGGAIALVGGKILGSISTNNFLLNVDDHISGYGVIGNGWSISKGGSGPTNSPGLFLSNSNGASIDATGGAGHSLTLDTGANWIENAGLIESTGAGGLIIESSLWQDSMLIAAGTGGVTVEGGVQFGGLGTTEVLAGSKLVLNDARFSNGGLLDIGMAAATGGLVTTTAGNLGSSADELRSDVHNYGRIQVVNNSELMFDAYVLNGTPGQLDLDATTGVSILEIVNGATVYGGSIVLSNDASNEIFSAGAYDLFTNDSKLSGSGVIGDGYLRLLNGLSGVIDADGTAGLTIVADTLGYNQNPQTRYSNSNSGLIEATSAGASATALGLLKFEAGAFSNSGEILAAAKGKIVLNGALINSGGGEEVVAAGGLLLLEHGADISRQNEISIAAGGTLTTASDGATDEIEASVFNSGAFDIAANSTLLTEKQWVNDGSIYVGASGAHGGAKIVVDFGPGLDLLDGGTVYLRNIDDSIVSAGSGSQFWNRGETIVGEGTIGDANLAIYNTLGSTIDATGYLTLGEALGAPTIQNGGLMEATRGGTLEFDNNLNNTGDLLVTAGGDLIARGAVTNAGRVDLDGGTAEFGGVVTNQMYFDAGAHSTLVLDDPNIDDGNVSGFAAGGNAIDIRDFKYGNGHFTELNTAGTLDTYFILRNSLGQDSTGIGLDGNFTASAGAFSFKEDNAGGTIVYWTPKV